MPKIIENLKDRLLAEAKQQIERCGYSAVTVRSIARSCNVGVGTVYNYFPSKEVLIASYLLEDWQNCMDAIQTTAAHAERPQPVLECMYQQLTAFSECHKAIFRDEAAASGVAGSFSQYHDLLRSQLSQPLRKFCSSDFTSDFIAESLLTWTVAGRSFEEIYELLNKLF